MSAGHAHRLYRAGGSLVHRLPPQCKLVATAAFVLAVVTTPREQLWAFGTYAVLLGAVAMTARVPPGFVMRRMVVELPFAGFALLLPFLAVGERTTVLGLSVSAPGLWGAWNILAKGTLGVVASILLAATTELRALLAGLDRLHVPPLLVQIASFMLRYADVVAGEMRRMRIARESRAFQMRDVRQLAVVAQSAGALFVRLYERGERVHFAMLSRGFTGQMPLLGSGRAPAGQWAVAALLPASAVLVALAAWAAEM